MTVSINRSPEIERKLRALATERGQEPAEYARSLIERKVHEHTRSLAEALEPVEDPNALLTEAHRRLFPKLTNYLQQDGPGGLAGRQELLAESFAGYHRMDRAAFENLYDAAYVHYLETVVIAGAPIP